MKIHEFGLWFGAECFKPLGYLPPQEWFTAIPKDRDFSIWYDGECLGDQLFRLDFILRIYSVRRQHLIKLKGEFPRCEERLPYPSRYKIGRCLAIDDFEIVPNPDYRGT
jgi:hypothetical protein